MAGASAGRKAPGVERTLFRFFFYGTLLDEELRGVVLGPRGGDVTVRPATLAGWRRWRVRGATYPMVRKQATASVDGLVADGITAEGSQRLADYEGDGYALHTVKPLLDDGTLVDALVFLPTVLIPASEPWSFADWQRRHQRETVARLRAEFARWRPERS